jgi:hypothetical protein
MLSVGKSTLKGSPIEHEGRARPATANIPGGSHISRCIRAVSHPHSSAANIPFDANERAISASVAASWGSCYRDLSALSPEQLRWVRQNHLEAAKPGIAWKYRRVEITEGGFPIIHINDHCVAIPFLMMMVFCKIGRIEPKGDLFEHMRDPHDP